MTPLLSGTTGQTVFVTYLLENTSLTGLTGLHCNHYCKIIGGTVDSDVSIQFNDNDFKFMGTTGDTVNITGYSANKFYILVQIVNTGEQPDPALWKIIDFTDQFTLIGGFINPDELRGTRFIITDAAYDNAPFYDLEEYLGEFPNQPFSGQTTEPEFGDNQTFTGNVKLTRATDLEIMNYLINLPSTDFMTTQNPSYVAGEDKRITEAALLDSNKEVLVIAKASSPIKRVGTQVLSVKIDL